MILNNDKKNIITEVKNQNAKIKMKKKNSKVKADSNPSLSS
jgi:hypothetical protein